MKAFSKNEDGAVIVLVALSMTVFIGFLALVIDMGSLYLEKNRLQKIVDAAALAGAQELPSHFSKAKVEIDKTIQLNNSNPNNFSINTNADYTMIEVTGTKKATFYFAKALGFDEPDITAKARVELQALTSGKGAIPLGVQPTTNLSFGTLQVLKVSDSANGNFGAIALTGPGAKDYKTDLTNGYQFELKIGQILNTQTGQLAGPTKEAVDKRIASCPNATYLTYPTGCSRVVLIPIYEPVQTDQNQIKQVRIVGFGTFFLEGVSSTSGGAEVTGRFIRYSQSGESSSNQKDYGTYSFKLTD
ncbi:pilus assembly protein TadG-related protein [Niallia sp. Krafla_26]|uniref:pilus assembly protein TadG-related protein n=1 Tax=Niallia sp. Krafla_26 TaxID=3064703 RepID=UPI003D183F3B